MGRDSRVRVRVRVRIRVRVRVRVRVVRDRVRVRAPTWPALHPSGVGHRPLFPIA